MQSPALIIYIYIYHVTLDKKMVVIKLLLKKDRYIKCKLTTYNLTETQTKQILRHESNLII